MPMTVTAFSEGLVPAAFTIFTFLRKVPLEISERKAVSTLEQVAKS